LAWDRGEKIIPNWREAAMSLRGEELKSVLPLALSLSPTRAERFLREIERSLGDGPRGEGIAHRIGTDLLRSYADPPLIRREPILYRRCRRVA
jgi:hypothetical protein